MIRKFFIWLNSISYRSSAVRFRNVFFLFSFITAFSCYEEEVTTLKADFEISVVNDDFSVPVEMEIINKSEGAEFYEWHFEGATMQSSSQKNPENIWYRNAGEYTVRLDCRYKNRIETKEMKISVDSAIHTEFDVIVPVNEFAPVTPVIVNRSTGCSLFEWYFDGRNPVSSAEKNPPSVTYNLSGNYTIRLVAGNERETKEFTRNITVLPRLDGDFATELSFDDFDSEAPAVVYLKSNTTSALHYKWAAEGGIIENDTAANTSVFFPNSGKFSVSLTIDNDKETKQIEKSVELFDNRNLLTLSDLRMGISAAEEHGQFFSAKLRKILKQNDIDDNNGAFVDLAFFGMNNRFSYCRFLSPDSADLFTFYAVPNALKTFIINDLVNFPSPLDEKTFDAMNNDAYLRYLPVNEYDTGNLFFNLNTFPKIILFETSDGRRGALKIKNAVDAGQNSYITVDIKIQKTKPL